MADEYFVDPDDFCRQCRGKKRVCDHDGSLVPCDQCGGSGHRSVRVLDPVAHPGPRRPS